MARLDTERQEELEPRRIEYAVGAIERAGYRVFHTKTAPATRKRRNHRTNQMPYMVVAESQILPEYHAPIQRKRVNQRKSGME